VPVDARDRYCGVPLGLAGGDALGATVQRWPRAAIDTRFGTLRRFQAGGRWAAGETTDDTAQAMGLADLSLAAAALVIAA